ncbi:S-adenosylmethionine:tRNA ribosyltransferase-isomerase [Pseudoflavitalea sp. G-6-1-2]|uniref:S-adenosylmethionine:tRNA ribosyltransferase-isomerase n=1 Tax=Pseudoflavitalea sp. G-6-1-2 TaxID=2728841 RepID=UPI00146AC1A5|nr:S-adenosylmethionine:tRNA ribosyltransferase-isomerase [Pseudoflavitalea sp. G-6-1-2]NML20745.1 S-adenosylmethionine:tRNA ribosyltransferase-isomerase [Pseudoflavitalea sp. G-6-1-2]
MHPKHLSIKDFTYELPDELIARYPLPDRDASRLLIWKNANIREDFYRNLDQYLPNDSLLVFNNTRVVAARLLFQKHTGGMIEIFCLEPHSHYPDITTAMASKGAVTWMCLVGGASKWKPGTVLEKKIPYHQGELLLHARIADKIQGSFIIELSWNASSLTFAEVLHLAGEMPLPPYIKRRAEFSDLDRYQTIYAAHEGSVAAPTAGLHFTDRLFRKLDVKNIQRSFVTLHVGAGTFQPVKADTLEEHPMHIEFIEVTVESIRNLIKHIDDHITAVGTTSLRTIESLYWLGLKVINEPDISVDQLVVKQWDAYEMESTIPAKAALVALLQYLENKHIPRLLTRTQLLIAPGYKIRIPHALVTNFHQPQSTLLLLVAAFAGAEWKKIYKYALEKEFRFLSYGDGCLLFRIPPPIPGATGAPSHHKVL